MDICVKRYPCIAYDGTNSAAILALGADSQYRQNDAWSIHSEAAGVLTLKWEAVDDPTNSTLYPMAVGDYAIGEPRCGLYGVVPADQFADQWHILAP